MRATGAVLLVIGILAIGFVAVSYVAQDTYDAAVTNGTNQSAAAYNVTEDVTETAGQTLPMAAVYGGLGAMALLAAGLIVTYGPRGRGR